MNRMRRAATAALGGALVATAFAQGPDSESKVLLRAQMLKLKRENEAMRRQNDQIRSDIASLKMLVEQLVAGGAAASRGAGTRPAAPPPASTEMSEEERALAAEFEAELAGEHPQASGIDSTKLGAPATPRPGSTIQPVSAPRTARRSFWGTGGVAGQSSNFDLGLTSEFIAGRAKERGRSEFTDTFSLRETELALGGFVDPYHRADLLFIWNDAEGETEIEEGFMTFFNLPEGWRARVGKFRSRTGPVNGLHFADLPWISFPKVNEAFLGEEGFGAAGARLTYLGQPRGKWSWSVDMEAFRGDNETLVDAQDLPGNKDPNGDFDADRFKDDIILSAHFKNSFQLDDRNVLDFGYSRIQADNDRVKLDGYDLTYRILTQPGRNEWRFQGEYMEQQREDLRGTGDDDRDGWYAWVDRRFNRNMAAGFRVDRVDEIVPGDLSDESWLAYLTYYPTEFSWYRLQYQEDKDELTNIKDKQVFLQFRWQLGVDRHALQ